MKKTIVALIYDFDKTLCDRDMQEYAFIPNLGLESEEFWHEVDEFAINNRMDKILACMYMMVHKSEKKGTPLKRETCINLGQYIKFYPGITDWFERINNYGKSIGIQIEHYIISSGLKENYLLRKEICIPTTFEFLFQKSKNSKSVLKLDAAFDPDWEKSF